MKLRIMLLLLLLVVVSVGCTSPPEEVPRADVGEDSSSKERGEAAAAADAASNTADVAAEESFEDVKVEDAEPDSREETKEEEATVEDTATDGLVTKSFSSESTFEFEGYGPGKSHKGVFETFEGSLTYDADGKLTAATITVDASSVKTDSDGLDKHLRNEDFFDVEKYPTITATSTSISEDSVTGTLNFHGVSKEITFPITTTDNSVSTDFVLDSSLFGINYNKVNKDVRMMFTLVAQD